MCIRDRYISPVKTQAGSHLSHKHNPSPNLWPFDLIINAWSRACHQLCLTTLVSTACHFCLQQGNQQQTNVTCSSSNLNCIGLYVRLSVTQARSRVNLMNADKSRDEVRHHQLHFMSLVLRRRLELTEQSFRQTYRFIHRVHILCPL